MFQMPTETISLFRRLAPIGEFSKPDQADAICPVLAGKINRFALHPNQLYKRRRPAPATRGVSRSSRTLARDAVDAWRAQDERACSGGRRSRVVLASRR